MTSTVPRLTAAAQVPRQNQRHVRLVTAAIRCQINRHTSAERVIGDVKAEHRTDRSYLKRRERDRINAIFAAGYNFGLLLHWLAELLHISIRKLNLSAPQSKNPPS